MNGFILGRIGGYVATLVAATLLIFFVFQLPLHNGAMPLANDGGLADWLVRLAHGDFGATTGSHEAIGGLVLGALAVTLPLAALSALFAAVIGLPLGAYAARGRQTLVGRGLSAIANLLAAAPAVAAAVLLAAISANRGAPLPGSAFWSGNVPAAFAALLLPALAAALPVASLLALDLRDAVREVRGAVFIRTGQARGLTFAESLYRHGRPSIAVAVVARLGRLAALLVMSLYAVEIVFGLPGLASLIGRGIGSGDAALLRAGLLTLVVLIATAVLAADLARTLVDPRLAIRIA